MEILVQRFFRFFVPTVLLLLTVQAWAAGIAGSWTSSNGNTINLVQNGHTVEGYYTSLTTESQQTYGYNIGDKVLYGTFDGTTLQGKSVMHFPVNYKHCASWEIWHDSTFTLSPDGNSLSGTIQGGGTLIHEDCSLSNTNDSVSRTLARKVETACSTARVGGISTNAMVGTDPANYMIAGIFVNNGSKKVLVRASSVDGVLDPKVTIQSFPDGTVLYSNSSWGSDSSAAQVQQLGYAPAKTTDAAMVVTLPQGLFTFTVSPEGVAGKGIIEVYEVDSLTQ